MSTPAEVPAGARPAAGVAVAAAVVVAVKSAVDVAAHDPSRRDHAKRIMGTVHQVANGASDGRASGLPGLPDVEFHGSDGAVVAARQRLAADGRSLREVVGVGENEAAAGRQAAEALGRNLSQPVPGLEAYGAGSEPAATVDDRTAVLDNRTVQNGLSTGSPTQQVTQGGLGAKEPKGGRTPQAQPKPDRSL